MAGLNFHLMIWRRAESSARSTETLQRKNFADLS
jgi:hypothetical protein